MSLAANIVVRNEIQRLPILLTHLRDIVDEIVIIDQHSDDGTLQYAIEHADLVLLDEQTGYACSSRQLAMENTNSDWILAIDADEFLSPTFKAEIPNLIQNTEVDGYMTCFAHTDSELDKPIEQLLDQHEYSKLYQYRLFRKNRVSFHNHLHGGIHVPHMAKVINLFYIGILEVKNYSEKLEDIVRYKTIHEQSTNSFQS